MYTCNVRVLFGSNGFVCTYVYEWPYMCISNGLVCMRAYEWLGPRPYVLKYKSFLPRTHGGISYWFILHTQPATVPELNLLIGGILVGNFLRYS